MLRYVMSCNVTLCYVTLLCCYVMLRYVTLRYVTLCYVTLCYVTFLRYVTLRYVMFLCYVMLCYVTLCCVILCYVVFCTPVSSSSLGPRIFLSTVMSNTLSLLSSLSVTDQVSHPYETAGRCSLYCKCVLRNSNPRLCLSDSRQPDFNAVVIKRTKPVLLLTQALKWRVVTHCNTGPSHFSPSAY
jgi:hypothetical protein